jgi:hypothetical protein
MHRAALAALVVLLPLTLGLRSIRTEERVIDSRRLSASAMAQLAREGWSVRLSEHRLIGWMILGSRGDCRTLVHFPLPSGESDEKFRSLAKSVGPVTYQYRGRTSREFPRPVPLLAWHVQRYARSFGIPISTAPLIAVAQSPSCGEQPPDFAELRQRLQAEHPGN